MSVSQSVLCGQMLVVGLAGTELGEGERRALAAGLRGGVVLFKRNVAEGLGNVTGLVAAVRSAAPADLPPLVAVDQEGGRVARLGPPALRLPPMREVGDTGDVAFARRLAEAQGRELRALGFTMSLSPVADVHTREDNPIIGDRAFGTTPERVAAFAAAWAEGLAAAGVLSCAKHFPGHGDTTVDSHLALPRVERDAEGLRRLEVAPFRALASTRSEDRALAGRAALDAMMTAHVVYPALDPERPATLSRAICTDLLRRDLGFRGVLFSDDLEMKAITLGAGEAAVLAVAAGCDALLVCSRADLADEAHAALVREAGASPAFRARCEEAYGRALAMRRRSPPLPELDTEKLASVFAASDPVRAELARRIA